ncbi:MAG: hypothetical protein RXR20_01130 [Paraburkholderia sp.]|jgi:hypothetical protein|uniref:hypothetical protein n=1 Tax=Burkholderiaceae TaxID=119060 RepID=UPI002017E284|nr:hypothetical protein [Burkholderia sp. 4M9327F10]
MAYGPVHSISYPLYRQLLNLISYLHQNPLRLRASEDGKSVQLVECDERKAGTQRDYRFEITTGEPIALIRSHGIEVPEENSGAPTHSGPSR